MRVWWININWKVFVWRAIPCLTRDEQEYFCVTFQEGNCSITTLNYIARCSSICISPRRHWLIALEHCETMQVLPCTLSPCGVWLFCSKHTPLKVETQYNNEGRDLWCCLVRRRRTPLFFILGARSQFSINHLSNSSFYVEPLVRRLGSCFKLDKLSRLFHKREAVGRSEHFWTINYLIGQLTRALRQTGNSHLATCRRVSRMTLVQKHHPLLRRSTQATAARRKAPESHRCLPIKESAN